MGLIKIIIKIILGLFTAGIFTGLVINGIGWLSMTPGVGEPPDFLAIRFIIGIFIFLILLVITFKI